MAQDNTFTAEYVFEYYKSLYKGFKDTQTDLDTVKKFIDKFGKLYPNDIDATCDLLKDYVLARKGLF